MKKIRFLAHIRVGLLGGMLLASCQSNSSQETTVYLVRHAEKEMTDPSAKNPPLTQAGLIRAQHLAQRLQSVPLDAIYSTSFNRNLNTVKPLAKEKELKVQTYSWHDYGEIRRILDHEKGKIILVCGHGDNILPIIKNAGAKPPLDSIGSEDYQYLFKLVIHTNDTADATVETFH